MVEIRGSVELDIMSEEGGGGWNFSIKVISDYRACCRRLVKAVRNSDKSWQW